MKAFDSLLLYVDDTARMADFFHRLFGVPVVEQSVNFAMLALPKGPMLGLWARHDVKPAPTPGHAGFELGVTVEADTQVDAALAEALALGAVVIQNPVRLDFGYTFLVRSPEGHPIRVFSPSEGA